MLFSDNKQLASDRFVQRVASLHKTGQCLCFTRRDLHNGAGAIAWRHMVAPDPQRAQGALPPGVSTPPPLLRAITHIDSVMHSLLSLCIHAACCKKLKLISSAEKDGLESQQRTLLYLNHE